jgi:hypothetical protein
MFAVGDTVRFQRRLFVVVAVRGDYLTIRDDEGEVMVVRTARVQPA